MALQENNNKDIVGVIGLGNMGAGMASTLLRKGYYVNGFDISSSARDKAAEAGITILSLNALLASSDIVILSLPKAEHVAALSQNIYESGHKGLIVIDTTTSTAETSREIHEKLAEKEIIFVDAPVSGGPKGAQMGTMTMVVGAEPVIFKAIEPFLQTISSIQVNVGSCGAGNIVKICNNLLIASHLITTAEAIKLASSAGVTPENLLLGINKGSGRSAASEVNFPLWILNNSYNSGFTMGLMRKDVDLANILMRAEALDLPLSRQVMTLWQSSRELLADNVDFNEIVKQTDAILFGGE